MPQLIDLRSVRFASPEALWLLVVPAALALLWLWRVWRYRRDARRFHTRRLLPVRERLPLAGGLLFWLPVIAATACTIAALARPQARVSLAANAGIDLIVLQDGSASMHVTDVRGDRWQRSMRFLRVVAESLQWRNDRVAMALFAHIAAPQVRLTRDPNTLLFFLDHLDASPFPLSDDTTWDTNIETGIAWGIRLIDKDEELHGPSPNGKAFLLISDGQAWSGKVENELRIARARGIPVFVVGVGTQTGGLIPEAPLKPGARPPLFPPPPVHASLDRASLVAIASAGAGQYFELDRDDDRDISNRIIAGGRRRAPPTKGTEFAAQDLYWQCLVAAACLMGIGLLVLRERTELVWYSVAALTTLGILGVVIR